MTKDISMCANNGCPLKCTCYRFQVEPNKQWQSYADFKYKKGKCAYYISTEGRRLR